MEFQAREFDQIAKKLLKKNSAPYGVDFGILASTSVTLAPARVHHMSNGLVSTYTGFM